MSSSAAVSPFTVDVPEAAVADLRERLGRTRWPEAEPVEDWSQGIPLAHVQELCDYWARDYDMGRVEAQLNAFEQVKVEVGGLGIHALHVRSPRDDALPVVMTHGWPGSVVEFLDVIGPLTDPEAHGADGADAFHLVCPSLPGYGFSDKPSEPGWGVERIAEAWAKLMGALGYERYGAQGGDWGGFVTSAMGEQAPPGLVGIHLNIAIISPAVIGALGEPAPDEQEALAALAHYQEWEAGYSTQQATRPQTLGYGLVDSPAGQCAWIVEKFWAWTDNDGHPEDAVSRDRLLDNVMMYWLPGTGASSARLYWQSFRGAFASERKIDVPTAYTRFPKELVRPSERWLRTCYTDLRSFTVAPRGGHFAALEEPELFVDEVRAAFRELR